jgi:hypothetical protein
MPGRTLLASLVALLSVWALASIPAPARAQKSSAAEAQEHFDEGAKLYVEGEYSAAIIEFRKGHRLRPHPMFLYNIARAHQKLDQCDKVVDVATQALASENGELGARTRAKAQALVAGCRLALGAPARGEQITAARPSPKEFGEPGGDDAGDGTQDGGAEVAEGPGADAPPETPPPSETKSSGFGALGWIGVGALVIGGGLLGGAALTAGEVESEFVALEGVSNNSRTADARERRDPLTYQQSYEEEVEARRRITDRIETLQTRGQILLFSGIGLATVGGALVLVELLSSEPTDEDAPRGAALVPTLGSESVGIGLYLAF